MAGTIQPGILHQGIGKEHRENGLLLRMLLAYPPQKKDMAGGGSRQDDRRKSHRRLSEPKEAQLSTGRLRKRATGDHRSFTASQRDAGRILRPYADHQHKAETDHLAAAFSKLEETTARLALVLQLVRCVSGSLIKCSEIDETNMAAAIEQTSWFRDETRRVYQLLDQSAEDKHHADLARWIRGKHSGDVAPRDLVAGRLEIKDVHQAESVLQSLADSGFGEWYQVPTTSKGGVPTRRFKLTS